MVAFTGCGITVSTDKANYKQNEKIKITITNNLEMSIFSHIRSQTPVFCIEYIEKKHVDGQWDKLFARCQAPHCTYDTDVPGEIKPGENETMVWSPLIFMNGTSETIQPAPGLYRLSVRYEDYQKTEWKSVYTSQFTIH